MNFNKFKNKQIKEKIDNQDVMRDANMRINAILEETGLMIAMTLVKRPQQPKETIAQATTKE